MKNSTDSKDGLDHIKKYMSLTDDDIKKMATTECELDTEKVEILKMERSFCKRIFVDMLNNIKLVSNEN